MAALKLSGAQVSTAPTASLPVFPPTGMGMLTAPLWWAQMSLGDMIQECQAGTPSAFGDGLPQVPPGSRGSVGETRDLGRLSALLALRTLASQGLGKGQSESGAYRLQPLLGGVTACLGLRLAQALASLLGGRLPPTPNLRAQFASPWILAWTRTHYFGLWKPFFSSGSPASPSRARKQPSDC